MVVHSYDISITTFYYFFFDCGYLEVAMYCFVGNIPECIYQGSYCFRLEVLKYFNVGITCRPPQLGSQVQTGFITVLQSVILLCVLRLERWRMSQYNFLSLVLSCFDLPMMCCLNVNLLSKVMPRWYLTESLLGIVILLMVT